MSILTYVTIFYLPLAFCTVGHFQLFRTHHKITINLELLLAKFCILKHMKLDTDFTTSLWAVNDMFGTGTRGFAIITAVMGLGTYAAVFLLIHPPDLFAIANWFKELGVKQAHFRDDKQPSQQTVDSKFAVTKFVGQSMLVEKKQSQQTVNSNFVPKGLVRQPTLVERNI